MYVFCDKTLRIVEKKKLKIGIKSGMLFPRMSEYAKTVDEAKYIFSLIKDEGQLQKYNKIWNKVSNFINKGFDSEPVMKMPKSKIKSDDGKIKTNFYDNGMSKESFNYIYVSIILIDSVLKIDQNYYSQVFSEECKYIIKVKKDKYYPVIIEHLKTATKLSKPIK